MSYYYLCVFSILITARKQGTATAHIVCQQNFSTSGEWLYGAQKQRSFCFWTENSLWKVYSYLLLLEYPYRLETLKLKTERGYAVDEGVDKNLGLLILVLVISLNECWFSSHKRIHHELFMNMNSRAYQLNYNCPLLMCDLGQITPFARFLDIK